MNTLGLFAIGILIPEWKVGLVFARFIPGSHYNGAKALDRCPSLLDPVYAHVAPRIQIFPTLLEQ